MKDPNTILHSEASPKGRQGGGDVCESTTKWKETAGERVMQKISKFIEKKLKIKVNRKKSKVDKSYECRFPGHIVLPDGELGISPKNLERVKDKNPSNNQTEQRKGLC